jgi:hypothetical protein
VQRRLVRFQCQDVVTTRIHELQGDCALTVGCVGDLVGFGVRGDLCQGRSASQPSR